MRGLALCLVAVIAGCSPTPEEAHYVRVLVDTDLVVSGELDAFSISVDQDGTSKFNQSYGVDTLNALPQSLIIEQPMPYSVGPGNEYTLPVLHVSVTGYQGGQPVVWRSAAFRYSSGQVQVPLPLCFDCLNRSCPSGETCSRGACTDASTRPSTDEAALDALSLCGPR